MKVRTGQTRVGDTLGLACNTALVEFDALVLRHF